MNKKGIKSIRKSMQCPKCGSIKYGRFKRKNYPFGKKSRLRISQGNQCEDCNYIQFEGQKNEDRRNTFMPRK